MSRYIFRSGGDKFTHWERAGYTGDKSTPTPYKAWFKTVGSSNGTYQCNGSNTLNNMHSGVREEAYNKAYDRFIAKVKDKANMALNLAELNQTLDSVANGLGRLTKAFSCLKKGDPRGMCKALKQALPQTLKDFNNDAAGAWLAYQWAFKPTVQDVVKDLNRSVDLFRCETPVVAYGSAEKFSRYTSNSDYGVYFDDWRSRAQVKISAYVRISNNGLYRASQTGLTNPFALTYELIPFSFILDWVTNTGSIIGALDDFAGLELTKAHVTTKPFVRHDWIWPGPRPWYWSDDAPSSYFEEVQGIERALGISTPFFQTRNPFTGVTRAANALALLVSVTSSMR